MSKELSVPTTAVERRERPPAVERRMSRNEQTDWTPSGHRSKGLDFRTISGPSAVQVLPRAKPFCPMTADFIDSVGGAVATHERFGQSSERGALLEQLELQLADLEEDASQAEAAAWMAAAAATSEKIVVPSADSDEVARAFRDDVARCSDMMSPGVRCLAGG